MLCGSASADSLRRICWCFDSVESMPILAELSSAVKARRSDMGLSQASVASLAGLSRATIGALEKGKLSDLSLTRAERLANPLGLSLAVRGMRPPRELRGLQLSAQIASVSLSTSLPPEGFEHALLTGTALPPFVSHLRAAFDEVPLAILAEAAAEMERKHGQRREKTWRNMRQIALALGCGRGVWTGHA